MDLFCLSFSLSIYFVLSRAIMAGTIRKVKGFFQWDLVDPSAFIIAHTPVFETVAYDINYTILHHFSFDV